MIRTLLALACCGLASAAAAQEPPVAPAVPPPAATPAPATVRVTLTTEAGSIVVAVETERAPITAANFLRYVDQKRLDGVTFYRAVKVADGFGLVQGGVRNDPKRVLKVIAHEPTSQTGLSNVDATISMARGAPGTANGDFFIIVGDMSALDANPKQPGDNLGFAAFGHIVAGMDVVHTILEAPKSPTAGEGEMRGQMLAIEDVPGTGKTSLARALAASLALTTHRIQFTPDLLPSDVTGVSVYNQASHEFEFKTGPVFANVVIADEINRASPKTQSALLEVMEEGTVSADAQVYPMPRPFMVVATQNPIDMEGTYVLPEAQLDRFLMKLSVGYPSPLDEAQILRTHADRGRTESLRPVLTAQDVAAMIGVVRQVEVAPALEHYIVAIATATRTLPELRLGVSPRGSLALLRAARAAAAVAGRAFVVPEDVKALAPAVLTHRVVLEADAELHGHTANELVVRAVASVQVPRTVSAVPTVTLS